MSGRTLLPSDVGGEGGSESWRRSYSEMQVTPVNLKTYAGLGVVTKTKKNENKNKTIKNPMPANTQLSCPSLEIF